MELLLTVEQAAERLQLAPFTVRKHLREGRLRGIKRGAKAWRIPESALLESSRGARVDEAEVERLWARLTNFETHNAALHEIAAAAANVQRLIDERSERAAAQWYESPAGQAELQDWRALDGESFDFSDEATL